MTAQVHTYRKLLPFVALVVCLFLTVSVWKFWRSSEKEVKLYRFDEYTGNIVSNITRELNRCAMLLHGGTGLFAASEDVAREEWRAYYEYRQPPVFFPGILGIGFSRLLQPPEVEGHIQEIRAEGFPGYTVRPAGERDLYTAIVFMEPFDERNQRAFGYDMFSEPVRRAAMEQARDTGMIAMSGKVELVPEAGKNPQAGFLLYLPVYVKGMPLGSVAERRAAVRGYVFSPVRMDDFIQAAIQKTNTFIDFDIFDGAQVSPAALMYARDAVRSPLDENHKPLFASRMPLDLYGHQWTLAFKAAPFFEHAVTRYTSQGILAAGFVLSLLTFLFIQAQERTRDRALSLADEMTFALRESEEKYRRLTDSLPVGVSIIGPDMEVLAVNARMREWFPGIDYTQHPPCYAVHKKPPLTEPCEGCPVVMTFQDGQGHRVETKTTTSLGMRTLRVTTLPLAGVDGEISSVHKTMEDITEHEQAEEERVARVAAEKASQAKSAFVANMSHEIRTPLNAVLGFAQVLERDPLLTSRQVEHVTTIIRSGAHLLALINDILDISKIEAGRIILNKTVFCLHDFLDDVEMIFRSRVSAKGLQLLVERDENVPRHVTGDEGKLRQIFVNLVGNAVKFTETGGVAVRVRAEPVEGKTGEGADVLRLVAEVEDTGPGIFDQDIGRVFDAFEQAQNGAEAGGTGLGLAISRRFAEMMGGKITVTSQVGKGSCFLFEVLLQQAEGVVEQEKKLPLRPVAGLEPGAGPVRILVVDDVLDNRALLCEMLRPVGFEVAEAGDGVQALEVFERWAPHVVLMDLRMPVMDGYEAIRRIKATAAGRAIPIIAVTASVFGDDQELVLKTGADAYLRKPFRTEELFEILEKSLGLRYVFAAETGKTPGHPEPSITLDALAALPRELVQALRQAVEEGDIIRLTELIGQVEKQDSAAARRLQALADRYDYETLGQWLEKGRSNA